MSGRGVLAGIIQADVIKDQTLAKIYHLIEEEGSVEERVALHEACSRLLPSNGFIPVSNPFASPAITRLDDSCLEAICQALCPGDVPCVRLVCKAMETAVRFATGSTLALVGPFPLRETVTSPARADWLLTQPGVDEGLVRPHLCTWAAEAGRVDLLEWARTRGWPWSAETCAYAALNGHLDALQWARENGCAWDSRTCGAAAQKGHLAVLQWAWERNAPWDRVWSCAAAAYGGQLNILRWARLNGGLEWDEQLCAAAANGGHLHVLQWARAHGCHWNEDTCAGAAHGGHLEVLKWLRDNGCPWNEETCRHARLKGHTHVVKWALDAGCPGEIDV